MKRRVFRLVLGVALLAHTAAAQERWVGANKEHENPESWCRFNFINQGPNFKLAKVAGEGNARVHFWQDDENCPQAGNPRCIEKSYVVAGDTVLTGKQYGKWVCSWYEPQRGEQTIGWLPIDKLVTQAPTANPPIEQWIGTWKDEDNHLEFSVGSSRTSLSVAGNAYYTGLMPGATNVGEIKTEAAPQGNLLFLVDGEAPDQYRCEVSIKLVGKLLVVSDNGKCGGANVTFSGIYQQAKNSVQTPAPGSPERKAIMNALRVPVERELKKPVIFSVGNLRVKDGWAAISATILKPDGSAFDWSGTKFVECFRDGNCDTGVAALLRKVGNTWRVLDHEIGGTDSPLSMYCERRKCPVELR